MHTRALLNRLHTRRRLIGVPLVATLAGVALMLSLTPAAQAASAHPALATPSPARSVFINTLTSIPVFTKSNPSAGALDQFEQFDEGSAFGLMLAVATVSLWGYWAAGLLLSGSGGREVVESVVKIALSGIAIVMWPTLFRDAIAIVNGLCGSIVNAPFAAGAFQKLGAKLGIDTALTVPGAVGLATELGSGLRLTGGISIASFVATGDPFAWILDFVVVLLFMVGELVIEVERVALFATTSFIYVTGPIAIALWAFRGLTPVTGAFFRIAQAVPVIIVVWTILLVLFAIMNTAVAPVWTADPHAWFASIGDHLTALVLLWMLIFTPGMVRRYVGAGGAGATGVLRTAALFAGYRMFRGGRGGAQRGPRYRPEARAGMSGTTASGGRGGMSGTTAGGGRGGMSGTTAGGGRGGMSGTTAGGGRGGMSGTTASGGRDGMSGTTASGGRDGMSGTTASGGRSGTSGTSRNGRSGTSGTSRNGRSGTSGTPRNGRSGTSGTPRNGRSGTSGTTPSGGRNGTSGTAIGQRVGTSSTTPSGGRNGTSSTTPSGGRSGTSGTTPSGGRNGTSGTTPSEGGRQGMPDAPQIGQRGGMSGTTPSGDREGMRGVTFPGERDGMSGDTPSGPPSITPPPGTQQPGGTP